VIIRSNSRDAGRDAGATKKILTGPPMKLLCQHILFKQSTRDSV